MKRIFLVFCSLLFTGSLPSFAQDITPTDNIIYVKHDAQGEGTGSSWEHAVPELADALLWAWQHQYDGLWSNINPLQIWVAEGAYKPKYIDPNDPEGDDRAVLRSFLLLEDVHVYGGFEGSENLFSERNNWKGNPTILSGQLDEVYSEDGVTYENVSHVVTFAGEFSNSILDGFTITGGNAIYDDGILIDNDFYISGSNGGGIYVQDARPTLRNLIIRENRAQWYGGGLYVEEYYVHPEPLVVENVVILSNEAEQGGGILHYDVELIFKNCVFQGNVAERGGAIYSFFTEVHLLNTLIAGNKGSGSGYAGGIYLSNSKVEVINSTISSNRGGAIYLLDGGQLTAIKNSVLYSNEFAITGIENANVENSFIHFVNHPHPSNLPSNTNPKFVESRSPINAPFTDGDFRLSPESPLLNMGNNIHYPDDLATDTDLAGNPRVKDGIIDIGAFEGGHLPLPVTMTFFEARLEAAIAQLHWRTVLEENVSHFEVQRSYNGRDFEVIGSVVAQNRNGMDYRFDDPTKPNQGNVVYYRLRTIDWDGTFQLSPLVSVEWENTAAMKGKLYPNPVRGSRVIVDIPALSEKAIINVYDFTGRVIPVTISSQNASLFELDIRDLTSGLYFIQAMEGGMSVWTERLLVEK